MPRSGKTDVIDCSYCEKAMQYGNWLDKHIKRGGPCFEAHAVAQEAKAQKNRLRLLGGGGASEPPEISLRWRVRASRRKYSFAHASITFMPGALGALGVQS